MYYDYIEILIVKKFLSLIISFFYYVVTFVDNNYRLQLKLTEWA